MNTEKMTEAEFYQEKICNQAKQIKNVEFLRKVYTILNHYIKKTTG